MDAPKGTIIAFAAQPKKVASQGPGRYSYFTEALAQEIVRSGISARDMLLEVRKKVHQATKGRQLPVVEDQALDKFYFGPVVIPTPLPPQRPEYSPPVRKSNEVGSDGMFVAYANGVVLDRSTGLEWVAGPDRNMTWYEAKSWVESLNIDGGGWRMPTPEELSRLYKKGAGTRNMTPLLETTGWYVWSGKTKKESVSYSKKTLFAWVFNFETGYGGWDFRDDMIISGRGFAVRSRSRG